MRDPETRSPIVKFLVATFTNLKVLAAIIIVGTTATYVYLRYFASPEVVNQPVVATQANPTEKSRTRSYGVGKTVLTQEEMIAAQKRIEACTPDYKKLCNTIRHDDYEKVYQCLEANEVSLSEQCRAAIKEQWQFRLYHEGAAAAQEPPQ